MKQKYFYKVTILFIYALFLSVNFNAQSRGDLAFTGYNVDGDEDFSIVALADIAANSTIYFTDYDWDEATSSFVETGNDGFINWNTGPNIIKAGTIIVFTDIDNPSNTEYGVSIGTITSPENFSLLAGGETTFAYVGTDKDTPTTFITGIKNGAVGTDLTGTGLGGTDLVAGTDFLEFNPTLHPDGGVYSGNKTNQTVYSNYLPLLTNKANWTANTEDGEAFLPYSQTAFVTNTTFWNGSVSSVWNLAGNWSNGVPTSSSKAIILSTAPNPPIISSGTAAFVADLTISNSVNSITTINSGNSLTVSGTVSVGLDGDLNINSGGSLIIRGTISGPGADKITYNRNLPTTNWYLASSPVAGETGSDLATNSDLAISTTSGNEGNIAVGTYQDAFIYNQTGELFQGAGYAVKKASTSGDLIFTGSMSTTNVKRASLTTTSNKFNLVGNPYPSYISANPNANGTHNFLTINSTSGQDELEEYTLWVWNAVNSEYDEVSLATTSKFIAPGQGFFVKVKSGSGDGFIDFTENMQSHQSVDGFSKTNNERTEIKLSISNNSKTKDTDIFYINGTTKEFDNGYDSSLFTAGDDNFILYTSLVANSKGERLGIQSLPDSDHENMVIPLGVNAGSNTEVTFKANALNLPNNMKVFLEDRLTNTYTRLDESNSEYTITSKENLNGTGRFYLHTKSSTVLNTETENLNNIAIFKTNNSNLKITGLNAQKANISLYNVIGKQVFTNTFDGNLNNTIALPNLATGMYIAKLKTANSTKTKKIIID